MLALVYKALSATGLDTQHYKSCFTLSNYINKLPPELRLGVLQLVSYGSLLRARTKISLPGVT
jgi:hypothetical protein